ncbi:hydrogenase [Malaciobacter molluscorum LMG 25693]|uniref:2-hydroxyacyl-CoA dehydratase activator protein n=1 Tax=Malaciobacter molluscorum LMG 25693 TaxID=870501 RepID=A0A2G1DLK4_9BACT|nr:acyl-CoA dehydratase activase [Malaciobacter molluscorum]AXX92003.1 2-hydroxyacyl-CoA dehydratase activator protein [Malaciobacter molluscorum LMG 25693]PHO19236.1 hydrogenase [Malaciobacter molluscorum LMG 25693]
MFWGVDVGSTYTKICGLDENRNIIDTQVIPTIVNQDEIVKDYLKGKQIKMLVSTGYGRHMIEEVFSCPVISEINAHAKGAYNFLNSSDMVIDLGGQDSKIIKLDLSGGFTDFKMNDKCAAGTGRFLEIASNRMGLKMQEFSKIGFEATKELSISSMCAVFAESEVISLIAKKESAANICYAVHDSIASRLASMAKKFAINSENIIFTGGGALNPFLIHLLSKKLQKNIQPAKHPQLIGAIGAACAGYEVFD